MEPKNKLALRFKTRSFSSLVRNDGMLPELSALSRMRYPKLHLQCGCKLTKQWSGEEVPSQLENFQLTQLTKGRSSKARHSIQGRNSH
ncbi:uncharacterized protein LOC112349409 isoform X3 [Selaginella moellendorffii]|uniref:uncharacterized protein LOC112349409 isoform X3 n=1 Tax=Selaginella moellendorffii TaxID=88036 RepID=UPI000D1C2413|nr:uncharacterized protein LOC112349409 isoform X3 [Selaginella moellendorffii]|eukprot:XP_024539578.1 uncharacterized protein LOC112349409 isoform X3 [Selaginella moellendorffii]